MLNIDHLCPGCLGSWEDPQKPCPHCGFSWEKANTNPRLIPLFTVIGGRYLLGSRIGAGGFGILYRAMDLVQEQQVAVKEFFPAELARREEEQVLPLSPEQETAFRKAMEGFRQEAYLLSQAKDIPGIVPFRDCFSENGTCYLIMDYVPGISLARCLRKPDARFSQEEALQRMLPVLAAVSEMHQRGILHRDISPENLILGPDGSLTLIDFGAAREYTAGEANLTVILKPGYAPEEQYHTGSRQGPWTDVYACCAVLYQMVSGILPQDAASRRKQDRLLPLDQLPDIRVTPGFARAIEKGVSLEAADRFGSIRELMAALEASTPMEKPSEAAGPKEAGAQTVPGPRHTPEAQEALEAQPAPESQAMPESQPEQEPQPTPEPQPMQRQGSRSRRPLILAGAAVAAVLLCAVFLLNRNGGSSQGSPSSSLSETTLDLSQMEEVSVWWDGTSIRLEIPAQLMELCERGDGEGFSLRLVTDRYSVSLITIDRIPVEPSTSRIYDQIPLYLDTDYLYCMDIAGLVYQENPETNLTQEQLALVQQGVRAMRVHTPSRTYSGEELLRDLQDPNDPTSGLSLYGCLCDWSLTLPEEMAGYVQTRLEIGFDNAGTFFEAAQVSVYGIDTEGSQASQGAFRITVGDIDPDGITGWYSTEITENVWLGLSTPDGVSLSEYAGELEEAALAEAWEVMLANLDAIVLTSPSGEETELAPLLLGSDQSLHWASEGLGISLTLPMELKNVVQCTATDDRLTLSLDGVQLFSISRADSPGEEDADLGNGVWLQMDYLRFVQNPERVFPEGTALPETWEESWELLYSSADRVAVTLPDGTETNLFRLLDSAQGQASYYSDTPQVYTDPDYGWRMEFPAELFLENGGLSWEEMEKDADYLNGLYVLYVHINDSGLHFYSLYVYVLEEDAPDPEGFHPEYIVEVYRGNGIRMVTIADDLEERMVEDGVSQALQDAIRQVCLITPDGQPHYLWQ